MTEKESVRRELLTYLSRVPQQIHENGPHCIGEVAVQLGNCLLWIHQHLEEGPKVENPLHESAQSIWALGKQFRQVGLYWWDQRQQQKTDRIMALEKEIQKLTLWLSRVDESLSQRAGL